MLISYEDFNNKLKTKLSDNIILYYDLLVKIINNPYRFIGNFRVTNTKTKLVQYVTQSREILFGYFMEDIIYEYLSLMGYTHMDKYIGQSSENKPLNADQLFSANDTIYLIEQKIRDDHDSSKKRGQFNNFKEKISLLTNKYPHNQIISIMWFIDDNFNKNKNFYKHEISTLTFDNVFIKYGKELFEDTLHRIDVWDELYSHLETNYHERSHEVLQIPDLDTSNEFLEVLRKLKDNEKQLYKKLTSSNKKEYIELRSRLFPNGTNFRRI